MAARLMWGTPNDAARTVHPDAAARAEANDYTLVSDEEVGGPPGGPSRDIDWPLVPGPRQIFAREDGDTAVVVAIAHESVAGSQDVLAAVEADWKRRTGRTDVRQDAGPPAQERPVEDARRST